MVCVRTMISCHVELLHMTRQSTSSETFSQPSRESGKLRIASLQNKLKNRPKRAGLIIALLLMPGGADVNGLNGVMRGLNS